MTHRHKARIRQWMLETVSNGGIERLDDLHVDKIDEGWQDRSTWVSAGLSAYQLAVRVQEKLGLAVTVALAFSLVDDNGDSREVFETRREFENQLDWSPPSLYLFRRGDRRHLSETARVNPLPEMLLSELPGDTQAFLLRWADENGNQRRSVFIQA